MFSDLIILEEEMKFEVRVLYDIELTENEYNALPTHTELSRHADSTMHDKFSLPESPLYHDINNNMFRFYAEVVGISRQHNIKHAHIKIKIAKIIK
jgi:hypothetical protein